jgi:hypothetical protein
MVCLSQRRSPSSDRGLSRGYLKNEGCWQVQIIDRKTTDDDIRQNSGSPGSVHELLRWLNAHPSFGRAPQSPAHGWHNLEGALQTYVSAGTPTPDPLPQVRGRWLGVARPYSFLG